MQENFLRGSLNQSDINDLSSTGNTNSEQREQLEIIEDTFLGNNVSQIKPSKVGEIRILCFYGEKPLITIGPHCKL